jgi:hypothetical protein
MRIVAVVATLLLTGCISFLPSYDAAVYAKLDAAVTDLERIRAAVALPYEPKPSFDDLEPLYISALGGVIAAEKIASSRAGPELVRGRPDQEAAKLVATAVGECRAGIEDVMRRHQRTGAISPASFDEALVIDTCAIPRVMESRLRR